MAAEGSNKSDDEACVSTVVVVVADVAAGVADAEDVAVAAAAEVQKTDQVAAPQYFHGPYPMVVCYHP